MIKLVDILKEIQSIQYTKPNFEFEWEEATRYPEFEEMGKEEWIKLANKGHKVKYSKIKRVLSLICSYLVFFIMIINFAIKKAISKMESIFFK